MARTKKPIGDSCRWRHDDVDESWDGDCGAKWVLTEGTPTDHKMRFCPECGRKLKVERGAS